MRFFFCPSWSSSPSASSPDPDAPAWFDLRFFGTFLAADGADEVDASLDMVLDADETPGVP